VTKGGNSAMAGDWVQKKVEISQGEWKTKKSKFAGRAAREE